MKANLNNPEGVEKSIAGNLTSYDVVPYPSYTHPQTHPDRLAVIGLLFGLGPARVDSCRVLELGCGNGSNLIPMAFALPGSEFWGLDLAAQPIAHGQRMIQEISLTNVHLLNTDLTKFESAGGKFDYIIAHGLYSWVPADIRAHLLRLCSDWLAPQGIAFISYNAFPGAHLRKMLREMMLFHVRGMDSSIERVRQAQALVKFLAEAQAVRDEYQLWMKAELESILAHEEGHLYHDELAKISEPFYFLQFVESAAANGLQYLGEADYFEMFGQGLQVSTRDTLKQLGRNRLLHEQYLDFLKCRRFRQTLLCHRELPLQDDPLPDKVTGFFIGSSASHSGTELNLHPGVNATFVTPKGAKCVTDDPLGKAALIILAGNDAMPMPFDQLLERATAMLNGAGISVENNGRLREKLAEFLLELYSASLVEFRTFLPAMARDVSERPVASPLARWQVRQGDVVTSQFHMAVKLEDEIGRFLISSLDGTLHRPALLEKLWQWLKARNALIAFGDNEADSRRRVEDDLERNLKRLARLGLLVG